MTVMTAIGCQACGQAANNSLVHLSDDPVKAWNLGTQALFPNVDMLTPDISDTVPFGTNKSGRQIFILTSISVHLNQAQHPGQPSDISCRCKHRFADVRCFPGLVLKPGPASR